MAGLVQGIVLVTFPAASTIFTEKSEYGLSSTQYGLMFLPQVVTAITASLLGEGLAARITMKRVYLLGLGSSTVSMCLLIASTGVKSNQSAAYPLLLVATAFLGAGFGLAVPVLNTYAAAFHPAGVDRAVLVLNALLGLGTALAPVFVAVFVGLGFWWGLPVMSVILLVVLLLFSARLPLRGEVQAPGAAGSGGSHRPRRFWFFAAFAVLYGICETMNGNWSQLDMTTRLGASATQASFALAAFWGMVTIGRILFAALGRWVPEQVTYRILPFVLVATFLLVWRLPSHAAGAGIAVFALAGLGCSALLPLTISFGEKDLAAMSAAVAGGVIAFYQLGYGIAAFGVGPLQRAGLSLSAIFGCAAVAAGAMGVLSFVVAPGRPRSARPATEQAGSPRPSGHNGPQGQ
ncbi:MFS transporter [Streptacidiphilus anmyonensis]|uniref:MFS transporter n=1 Tax=Streptacidiphilus anmyonensis TaxID=405782 RepID=UPI000694ABA5|nr:MFS transporter [Streptacidiphilus anmyonensis]